MTYSLKVELWKDPGFQEGSVIVPSKDDTLYNPDFTVNGLHPPTGNIFSQFKFYGEYLDYMTCKYLRATYTLGSSSLVVYGWVDSVACSSTGDNGGVVVSWHIDLWRTYAYKADYGYGVVTRRARAETDPPQTCSYRYRLAGDYTPVDPDGLGLNWLVFTYVKQGSGGKEVSARTCVLPLDRNNPDTPWCIRVGTDTSFTNCPNVADIAQGLLADKLGISASQITSAFVSPIPPFKVESTTTNSVTFQNVGESTEEEELTAYWDDSRVNRLVSSGLTYYRPDDTWTYSVEMSDGSTHTYTDLSLANLKAHLDETNGVTGSTEHAELVVNGTFYRVTVADLMSAIAPDVVFADGDTVTIAESTTERNTSIVSGGGSTYYSVTYTVTLGTLGDNTFTYDGGWPDTYVYTNARMSGEYTYHRSNTQYAVSIETTSDDVTYGYAYTTTQNFYEYSDYLGLTTTDTQEWVLTDMSGSPIGTLPWGIEAGDYTARVVMSSTTAYVQLRFAGLYSASDGLEFTIPLPAVDVCSNSWSDYVYSGQREYDISQRKIASQQALVSGITSSVTGGVSNSIMASIGNYKKGYTRTEYPAYNTDGGLDWIANEDFAEGIGGIALAGGPRTRRIKGSGISPAYAGAASIGVGIGASLAEYGITQYYNGKLQKAEDSLQAKQFDSIVVGGNGWDWLWHGRKIAFESMVPDDYSLQRFNADIRLHGIVCSEPKDECTLPDEGPIAINELVVTGSDVPLEACSYLKARLANGVLIQTVNIIDDTSYTITDLLELGGKTINLPGSYMKIRNDTTTHYAVHWWKTGISSEETDIVLGGGDFSVKLESLADSKPLRISLATDNETIVTMTIKTNVK